MPGRTGLARHAPVDRIRRLPALQQPEWPDRDALDEVLRALPPEDLVGPESVAELRTELARLDAGGGLVLQLGHCVEDIDTDMGAYTRCMLAFLTHFRSHLRARTGRHVVGVGRLAGQYAKPRSQDHELVDGVRLPSYRGPIVNAPGATPRARLPRPERIAEAHSASLASYATIADHHRATAYLDPVWTSHEMLLLDYELRFVRQGAAGLHLGTTHWPWIGARTRQPGGAHVALAAALANPVSVKVGPDTSPEEAAELAAVLNPRDEPGKLTFIVRMGHTAIDRLGPVVRAVRRRVEHVHWISDPMHGNTVTGAHGFKTRHLEHIVAELTGFQQVLVEAGGRPAGLHLEATPEDVFECAEGGREPRDPARYRSLLDPRLNPEQTAQVLGHWWA
ncbi:3-deoxy-7-phosphoheptulonate synthase [Streptomyces sp. LE64]|uniref:3-deoxy-7-phosphoheptulonate synthase n=1 Tax=Streptomyces sp. LE64 TaxID=3448653 RepID=UPI00404316D7